MQKDKLPTIPRAELHGEAPLKEPYKNPVRPMLETGDTLSELPANRRAINRDQYPYSVFFPREPLLP